MHPGTIKKLTGGDGMGKDEVEGEFNEILKRIFRGEDDRREVSNDSRGDRRTPMYAQRAALGVIIPPIDPTIEDVPSVSTTASESDRDK